MSDKHPSLLMGTKNSPEKFLREDNAKLRNALDNREFEIKQLKAALALKNGEVDSLTRALNAAGSFSATHRHLKRGSEYQEMARGRLQTDVALVDYAELVAYRDGDGEWWFRSPGEFEDGRFEVLK